MDLGHTDILYLCGYPGIMCVDSLRYVSRLCYIYTTKIDGVVCQPNISETVAGRLTKLAHRQRIASTTIKLI